MRCTEYSNKAQWEQWLKSQRFSPFLQSYTMGEVYESLGQTVYRFAVQDDTNAILALCQATLVNARRGRHLAVLYGPVIQQGLPELQIQEVWNVLQATLRQVAKQVGASFVRFSPFFPVQSAEHRVVTSVGAKSAPMHVLSEHVWYIPLTAPNAWLEPNAQHVPVDQEEIFMNLRKTTRNLVRRAEKEGVHIEASTDPLADLATFIELHEETRKRHHFTPYTDEFFRAQVEHFHTQKECTLYKAYYQDTVISASIHMHYGGETSYHHGASTAEYSKIPSSYLLQWQAICDAVERGDHTYSFWGIAPVEQDDKGKWRRTSAKPHPFAGVTTFKTGFGGTLLNVSHCQDIVVSPKYYATRAFEFARKWKRGF